MNRVTVCAMALAGMAGAANAQSVEFRIVERTGQTFVTGQDSLLELAVQARVTGGNLGTFSFNIAMPGEAESFGTLNRALISNANHTYFAGSPWTTNNTIGRGGLASQYTFLASQGTAAAQFNGLINTSGGTFTNNPAIQEIGLVVGAAAGPQLIQTPGMDPDGEGNPATWSGYGFGNTAPQGALAALDPTLGATYFGGGQFVDIYRFTYNVTNFSARTLNITLNSITAQNFTRMTTNGIYWGAQDTTVPAGQISGAPLTITSASGFSLPIPAPGAAALLGLGGVVAARRRRAR